MKKLMIAAAAIAMVATSHAAVCSWTVTGVANDSGSLTQGSIYMFFAESSSDLSDLRTALVAAQGKGASAVNALLADANWSGVKKATVAGNFGMGTSKAYGYQTLPKSGDLDLTDKKSYYAMAVIFDTQGTDTPSVTDASHYLITATTGTATAIPEVATAEAKWALGSQAGGSWYAVTNVPEPTSGLLLLLGVGALALRRRRA